jgi:hypothetical protein
LIKANKSHLNLVIEKKIKNLAFGNTAWKKMMLHCGLIASIYAFRLGNLINMAQTGLFS